MQVQIEPDSITLVDVDDLKRFNATVDNDDIHPAEVLSRHDWGSASDTDDHLWISIAKIRAAVAGRVPQEWQESFAGMLDYAKSKGWLDEDQQHILAHIEPPDRKCLGDTPVAQ